MVTFRRRPDESRRRRLERWAGAGTVVLWVLAAVAVAVAPPDARQGNWQRLMYLHVPAAWTAFAAFTVVAGAGVIQLRRTDLRADRFGIAAAEVGVAATALTLSSGAIWGRATWGTGWAWDPRLVSTAALLLIYLAYLGTRGLTEEPLRAARWAAVVGLVGFVDVPVVYFSIRWWRTLHQQPTFLSGGDAPIDAAMARALFACVLAFSVTALWLLLRRVRHLEDLATVDALDLGGAGRGEPARSDAAREAR